MPQQFIILAQARSGSTLLGSLIDGHPQVSCHAELFSHVTGYPERFNTFLANCADNFNPKDTATRGALAHIYLDTILGADHHDNVGFKFLLEQTKPHPYALPYLVEQQKPVKFIRLIRENELKVLLSRRAAAEHKQWHSKKKIEKKTTLLPVGDELFEALHGIRQANKTIAEIEPQQPSIVVRYEDFQHDHRETIQRIQDFLEVAQHPTQSPFKKLTSNDLSQAITNYDEVRKYLVGSKFENCLEDDKNMTQQKSDKIISFVHIPKTGGAPFKVFPGRTTCLRHFNTLTTETPTQTALLA